MANPTPILTPEWLKQQERIKAAKALIGKILASPFYTDIEVAESYAEGIATLVEMRIFAGSVDSFCPSCKKDSTWELTKQNRDMALRALDAAQDNQWLQPLDLRMECTRERGHTASFAVVGKLVPLPNNQGLKVFLTKYGQIPSMRDFAAGDIKKFAAISTALRREFVQAINTSAHGFNVAACVHYRRVFEGLLHEVRDEHLQETGQDAWPEFDEGHIADKIRLLGDLVPDFIRENPHLYKLLSEGVHELSEEECADELPVVRQAIELVLEERVAQLEKRRRKAETQKLLADSMSRKGKREASKEKGD